MWSRKVEMVYHPSFGSSWNVGIIATKMIFCGSDAFLITAKHTAGSKRRGKQITQVDPSTETEFTYRRIGKVFMTREKVIDDYNLKRYLVGVLSEDGWCGFPVSGFWFQKGTVRTHQINVKNGVGVYRHREV